MLKTTVNLQQDPKNQHRGELERRAEAADAEEMTLQPAPDSALTKSSR